jgi:predicted transcriptional regulator
MGRGISRKEVYVNILKLIEEGKTRPEIQSILGLYPTKAQYYLNRLESWGFIKTIRSYPRTYELTPKGKRALLEGDIQLKTLRPSGAPLPRGKKVRIHAVQILIPVLKRGQDLPLKKEINLRGWVQRIVNMEAVGIPLDATVEITTKNVRVYLHSVEIPQNLTALMKFSEYVGKIVNVVATVFRAYGWALDVINYRVVNQHLEQTAEEYEEVAEGGVEIDLNRKAKAVTGNEMEQKAKAWTDKSPGALTIETNDALYEEKLLRMPENVDEIKKMVVALSKHAIPVLDTLREELEAHLGAVKSIDLGIQQFNLHVVTMNKLLHRLNLILEKLEKKVA